MIDKNMQTVDYLVDILAKHDEIFNKHDNNKELNQLHVFIDYVINNYEIVKTYDSDSGIITYTDIACGIEEVKGSSYNDVFVGGVDNALDDVDVVDYKDQSKGIVLTTATDTRNYTITKTYDVAYRRWLTGELMIRPVPLSSDALYTNFSTDINKVKSILKQLKLDSFIKNMNNKEKFCISFCVMSDCLPSVVVASFKLSRDLLALKSPSTTKAHNLLSFCFV
jgi:hypothetical protein